MATLGFYSRLTGDWMKPKPVFSVRELAPDEKDELLQEVLKFLGLEVVAFAADGEQTRTVHLARHDCVRQNRLKGLQKYEAPLKRS